MAGDAFQKFKSSLNRGVTTVNVKTSSSLEKMKIKTHIESINTELRRLVASVGEAAYQVWTTEEKDFTTLYAQFETIRQKREEIDRLNEEYGSIDERDSQILGTQVQEAAPQPQEPAAVGEIVCPNCGARYAGPVRFCRKCGTKLQE